jgi:hypothetical protein
MREPVRVFIGWDGGETVAYHVLAHSIIRRASVPVSITPLRQDTLREHGIYWRERGPTESTEFSLTRFLVPALSGFHGTSVFMDCDMLFRADVAELIAAVGKVETNCLKAGRGSPAVFCCPHDYQPSETVKFRGAVQTTYPRKNWSSFVVFRNDRCRALSPEYVNHASGLDLHRFNWLRESDPIGGLPLEWNWLVGEYEAPSHSVEEGIKVFHWTNGGPWMDGYRDAEFADLWTAECASMLGASPGEEVVFRSGVAASRA